jgi:hypothetical protein
MIYHLYRPRGASTLVLQLEVRRNGHPYKSSPLVYDRKFSRYCVDSVQENFAEKHGVNMRLLFGQVKTGEQS